MLIMVIRILVMLIMVIRIMVMRIMADPDHGDAYMMKFLFFEVDSSRDFYKLFLS